MKSIEETIRDSNILGDQLFLIDEMKVKFLIRKFQDAAKFHVIANCREYMTFTDIEKLIRDEFESDSRGLQLHMTLRGLRVERVLSENENFVDESDGFTGLVKRINTLAPKCPDGFRSHNNKIQFLSDSVIGNEWASQAISQITTPKYSFNGFVSALREGLKYGEEVKRHKSAACSTDQQTFYQQYGRPPRSVVEFPPKPNGPYQGNPFQGTRLFPSRGHYQGAPGRKNLFYKKGNRMR